MTDCEGTCDYVARKGDPTNWHGDEPDDWILDDPALWSLEQEAWECPHEALDGEKHCVFHTDPEDVPDGVDESERFIQTVNEASAVDDEETARRRKEFVGATFGALDIEQATLDAGDEHPIRLDHVRVAHGVNAKDAVFEHGLIAREGLFETGESEASGEIKGVSFAGTEFGEGEVSFTGAEFGEGRVSFAGAEFGEGKVSFAVTMFGEGRVSFSWARFGDGEVLFHWTRFGKGKVSFDFAVFGNGKVSFDSVEFGGGEVSFFRTRFGEGGVSFDFAEFGGGGVSFDTAEFGDGEVSFDRTIFAASLSFVHTKFNTNSILSFTNAEFRDDVTFGSDDDEIVTYEHSLDFSGATLHRALEFRGRPDSAIWTEQPNQEEPKLDLIFAGEVDFNNVTFLDGIDFSDTRFPSDADFSDAILENADFSDADVTGTDDISEASFDGANLSGANFSSAELVGASFERACLNRAELLGANFAGAALYGALLGGARINRETEFWLAQDDDRHEPDDSRHPVHTLRRIKIALRGREPYCRYDPRYRGIDAEQDLEKAGEMYATLETLASANSLPGLASECFLGRKDVQLREYRRDDDTGMLARSLAPTLVARYGESPTRVLGTGAVTVLACGLVYDAFDLVVHADSEKPASLFESLYFSGLTFTTLGYGDFTPANELGQVLAVVETSIGVVLLAILVFVFGRRATR